jgi:hypothetical protein
VFKQGLTVSFGCLPAGTAEDVNVLLSSWQPLPATQLAALSTVAGQQVEGALQPPWVQGSSQQEALTQQEQQLLAAVASQSPRPASARVPRPSSAPPHAKGRSRAVHTNPHMALQAGAAAGLVAAAPAGRRGVRGVDTISGVASRRAPPSSTPAAAAAVAVQRQLGAKSRAGGSSSQLRWQQRKPLRAQEQLQLAKAAAEQGPAGRGLGQDAAWVKVPAVSREPSEPKPAFSGTSLNPAAGLAVAGSQQAPPASQQQQSAALPSFLQPSAAVGPGSLLSSWKAGSASPAMDPLRPQADKEGDVLQLEVVERAVFAQLKPEGLRRPQLQQARALCQVDAKFIPIVCGQTLTLVDQHAAGKALAWQRVPQFRCKAAGFE